MCDSFLVSVQTREARVMLACATILRAHVLGTFCSCVFSARVFRAWKARNERNMKLLFAPRSARARLLFVLPTVFNFRYVVRVVEHHRCPAIRIPGDSSAHF